MVLQQIIDYITMHLDFGESKEQIKRALLASGWQEAKIDEAFSSLGEHIPLLPLDPQAFPSPEDTRLLSSASSLKEGIKVSAEPMPKNVLSDKPVPRALPYAPLPLPDSSGERAQSRKGRRKVNGIFPMVIGMMLGAFILFGTAFGFWHFVLSNRQSPEAILFMSIQKMAGIQSYGISGNTNFTTDSTLLAWLPFLQPTAVPSLDAPGASQPPTDIKQAASLATPDSAKTPDGQTVLAVSGDGASDSHDPKHPKGFFSLHIQADSPADRIKAKFGIDVRVDGESVYFKLNDVDLSNTSLAFLSRFAARWIEGNLTTLAKQYSASPALEAQPQNASDNVAKQSSDTSGNQGFSPQALAQLVSIFEQTKPFLVTALPETSEGGVSMYHLGIVPQSEGMKGFLLAILNSSKQNNGLFPGKLGALQEKDALAMRTKLQDPSFVQAVDQFAKQSTIEVWIGKTDFLVRNVFSRFTFGAVSSGDVTLNLNGYNQDVPVTLPSGSTPLDQVIQDFVASFAPAGEAVNP